MPHAFRSHRLVLTPVVAATVGGRGVSPRLSIMAAAGLLRCKHRQTGLYNARTDFLPRENQSCASANFATLALSGGWCQVGDGNATNKTRLPDWIPAAWRADTLFRERYGAGCGLFAAFSTNRDRWLAPFRSQSRGPRFGRALIESPPPEDPGAKPSGRLRHVGELQPMFTQTILGRVSSEFNSG